MLMQNVGGGEFTQLSHSAARSNSTTAQRRGEDTHATARTIEPPQKFEARQEYDIKATRPDTTRTIYDGIEAATNAASKFIPKNPNLGNIRSNTWPM